MSNHGQNGRGQFGQNRLNYGMPAQGYQRQRYPYQNQGYNSQPYYQQSFGPNRELILQPVEGVSGNGIAIIGGDNVFSVTAYLPPPSMLYPNSVAIYAVYLVDQGSKNGFYAGTLSSGGGGVYQMQFKSTVPLVHYKKVVVSIENPQNLRHAPQGPIVLKVKEGIGAATVVEPVKKVGKFMWEKVNNLIGGLSGNKEQQEIPQEQQGAPQGQGQYQGAPQGRVNTGGQHIGPGIEAVQPSSNSLNPGTIGGKIQNVIPQLNNNQRAQASGSSQNLNQSSGTNANYVPDVEIQAVDPNIVKLEE